MNSERLRDDLKEFKIIMKNNAFSYETKTSLRRIRNLLEQYLAVEMPREASIPETRIADPLCEVSFNKGRIVGRNQALSDCRLYWMKRMEWIEERIAVTAAGWLTVKQAKDLATTLKACLLNEKET